MTKRYQSLFLIRKFKNSNRVRENVCDEPLRRGFFYLQNFTLHSYDCNVRKTYVVGKRSSQSTNACNFLSARSRAWTNATVAIQLSGTTFSRCFGRLRAAIFFNIWNFRQEKALNCIHDHRRSRILTHHSENSLITRNSVMMPFNHTLSQETPLHILIKIEQHVFKTVIILSLRSMRL